MKYCVICDKEIKDYPCNMSYRVVCSRSCGSKYIWTGRKHKDETKQKMRKSPIWQKLDQYKKEYASGATLSDIAEKYNINRNSLRTIFKKMGVKMRRGGAPKGVKIWNKGKPYLATRGENHHNWKGGITSLNQQVRRCIEYLNWRRDIMKRDNYICTLCGEKKGGNLEVDHYPKKFADIMSENKISSYQEAQKCNELWDRNNGRTLCLKCHNRTKIKPVRSRFQRVGVTTRNKNSFG